MKRAYPFHDTPEPTGFNFLSLLTELQTVVTTELDDATFQCLKLTCKELYYGVVGAQRLITEDKFLNTIIHFDHVEQYSFAIEELQLSQILADDFRKYVSCPKICERYHYHNYNISLTTYEISDRERQLRHIASTGSFDQILALVKTFPNVEEVDDRNNIMELFDFRTINLAGVRVVNEVLHRGNWQISEYDEYIYHNDNIDVHRYLFANNTMYLQNQTSWVDRICSFDNITILRHFHENKLIDFSAISHIIIHMAFINNSIEILLYVLVHIPCNWSLIGTYPDEYEYHVGTDISSVLNIYTAAKALKAKNIDITMITNDVIAFVNELVYFNTKAIVARYNDDKIVFLRCLSNFFGQPLLQAKEMIKLYKSLYQLLPKDLFILIWFSMQANTPASILTDIWSHFEFMNYRGIDVENLIGNKSGHSCRCLFPKGNIWYSRDIRYIKLARYGILVDQLVKIIDNEFEKYQDIITKEWDALAFYNIIKNHICKYHHTNVQLQWRTCIRYRKITTNTTFTTHVAKMCWQQPHPLNGAILELLINIGSSWSQIGWHYLSLQTNQISKNAMNKAFEQYAFRH